MSYLQVPGAVTCSLTPTTLLHLLTDLVDSLERQGVRKLVLLNGHGGNELKPLTRELHHRTRVFLCVCDWYRMAADVYPQIFNKPGATIDTPANLQAAQHLAQWIKAGYFEADANAMDYPTMISRFTHNSGLFTFDGEKIDIGAQENANEQVRELFKRSFPQPISKRTPVNA